MTNNMSDAKFVCSEEALKAYCRQVVKIGRQNFRRPQYKNLKEKFQSAVLILGICKVTGRSWSIRLVHNDPPDFECCSISDNGKYVDWAMVESMSIPKCVREETSGFSGKGVAKFISDKKLSKVGKKYDHKWIFGVYFDFTKKALSLEQLAQEISKLFQGSNEVWVCGAMSPNLDRWFVAKVHPGYTHYESFSIDWERMCKPAGL